MSLALINTEADLAAHDDPGAVVMEIGQRAIAELRSLTQEGDLDGILTMKGRLEVLRVLAIQMRIGKEAELAASEAIRTAERGIGVTIRQGQDTGQIAQAGRPRGILHRGEGLARPNELVGLASPASLTPFYRFAAATDEDWDAAVELARVEGNLSRANILKKLPGAARRRRAATAPPPEEDRPDYLKNTHRHDPNRFAETIVSEVDAVIAALDRLNQLGGVDVLDPDRIEGWVASLSDSLRSLNRFHKQLKETTR